MLGKKPRLDFVGSFSFNGIGGDQIVRDGFFGPIVEIIPGGYGDALGMLFDFDFPSWRLGFNFSMPIGNKVAKGNYARATLAEDQASLDLERTRQQVTLEVRTAVRNVANCARQ